MDLFQNLPSVYKLVPFFYQLILKLTPLSYLGSIISGAIEYHSQKVYTFLPTTLGDLGNSFMIFPSCECGIVPTSHFLEKKVPSYTAEHFLVTAPINNPDVPYDLFSFW